MNIDTQAGARKRRHEKRTADADRAKYEHELRSLRMEHRELSDLRSLVFNREAEV